MNPIGMRAAVVLGVLCSMAAATAQQKPADPPVTLRFWGQACFTITADGKTLLFDPYKPEQVGYPAFDVTPDIVLISHEHYDHNDTSNLKGKPIVVHGLDRTGRAPFTYRTIGPFQIRTVPARHWHDPALKSRGNVAIFVVKVHDVTIVHVGDLGETLSDQQVKAIGTSDVLLVPIGGFWTIDADEAHQVVQQLKPQAYTVPMHYRTPVLEPSLRARLAEPTAFLQKYGEQVIRLDGNELRIDPATLPAQMKMAVLDYRRSVSVAPPAATQPVGRGERK